MAVEGLKEIHGARVIHNDAYLKNVLVVPRTESHCLVWVDFDVSIVFPKEEIGSTLNLNDEAAWEIKVFESRACKLVRL